MTHIPEFIGRKMPNMIINILTTINHLPYTMDTDTKQVLDVWSFCKSQLVPGYMSKFKSHIECNSATQRTILSRTKKKNFQFYCHSVYSAALTLKQSQYSTKELSNKKNTNNNKKLVSAGKVQKKYTSVCKIRMKMVFEKMLMVNRFSSKISRITFNWKLTSFRIFIFVTRYLTVTQC